MIYTVVWVPLAQAHLATLWNLAMDRQAVTDSADRIDRELLVDADLKGILFGPLYAYYDDPLAVLYEVDPGDCMVRILVVKRII